MQASRVALRPNCLRNLSNRGGGSRRPPAPNKKPRHRQGFFCLVPVGGLEPPLPKEPDFESSVSTNFTTLALLKYLNALCI